MREYQRQLRDNFLLGEGGGGFFLVPGLGKTLAAISTIDSSARTLVVAPKNVAVHTWPEELDRWAPDLRYRVLESDIFALTNRDEDQRQGRLKFTNPKATRAKCLDSTSQVDIVSYDFLAHLVKAVGKARWPYKQVIVDESSKVKTHNTERFKALRHVRDRSSHWLLLTGTPASQDLLGLWSQLFLIDGGARLGKTLGAYRDKWFVPDKRNADTIFSWAPKQGAREAIIDLISDVCWSTEAMPELPPLSEPIVRVDMPDSARRLYDRMLRDSVIDELDLTASNAAVLAGKLVQIANGTVYDDDRGVVPTHSAKLDALDDILDQTTDNVFILCNHIHDTERILARHPGAANLDDDRVIELWKKGQIRLAIGHPASCGMGLNLQSGGHTGVWYSIPDSAELYTHANKRLHRSGQQHPVIMHHLVTADSIEERKLEVLRSRLEDQDLLLAALALERERAYE